MNPNQSFSLNGNFFTSYPSVFINLIFVLIAVYALFVIVDFLREKYSLKEKSADIDHFNFVVTILAKVLPLSGVGFIIENILQLGFSEALHYPNSGFSDLSFGVILLFVGFGLRSLRTTLRKEKTV